MGGVVGGKVGRGGSVIFVVIVRGHWWWHRINCRRWWVCTAAVGIGTAAAAAASKVWKAALSGLSYIWQKVVVAIITGTILR